MTDEELVKKVVAGETELFRDLVERYEPKLARYAVYLTRDRDTADDIVQDTFIKAYRNLNGFNPKLKFSSWIYRIVHNEAINAVRKLNNTVQIDNEQWEAMPAMDEAIEITVDRKISRRRIAECLNELAVKYREPVVLFFFEQRSYREISDILRLPVATVGVRINRAKKLLQGICERKGLGHERNE